MHTKDTVWFHLKIRVANDVGGNVGDIGDSWSLNLGNTLKMMVTQKLDSYKWDVSYINVKT